MRTMTFELDQFQPWPELAVYVYGVATLSYEIDPGDAYSGCPRGVTYPTVESITIEAHLAKDAPQTIDKGHPLFAPICYILEQTDYAIDAIRRHDEQS